MRKLLILCFLSLCLQVPLRSFGQTISLEVQDTPLESVFRLVQQQSPYRFVYTSEDLAATKKITLSVSNSSIQPLLEKIFKDQPLAYNLRGQVIIVSRTSKTESPVLPDGIVVRGKVIDEAGNGLPAVSITLKGKPLTTATDEKGNFTFREIDPTAIVLVTSVGYESQQVNIAGRTALVIQLARQISTLEETVIKGYYVTSRRLNTGAVAKITATDIGHQPVGNPLEALEGRMSGVYVQQTTGTPGGSINLEIRGRNSLRSGGNFPLYIIDGVPFTSTTLSSPATPTTVFGGSRNNPMDYINPSDIESIEILKDADATAIYGSRGANGVVLITTKSGKAGKTKFDLNCYTGAGKVTRMMPLLNTAQYLQMRHEAFANDGAVPDVIDYDVNGDWDTTRNTDWQKELIGGTATITNLQASVSGGNANTQFLLGAGYLKQGTVFPGNFSNTKASGRLSINHASDNRKFTVNFSGSFLEDNNRQPQSDFLYDALAMPPDAPAYYTPAGQLNWQGSSWTNPKSNLLKTYKGTADNLMTNANVGYMLLPGLRVKSSFGFSKLTLNTTSVVPIGSWDPAFNVKTGSAYFSTTSIKTWIVEPQLEYEKQYGQSKITVLAGTTFQENITEAQTIRGTGFVNDALLENPKAAAAISLSDANYMQYRYNAFFGRINYDYKQTYLLNVTARRDGSSRFGQGKQFGNFGAIGAAWIFSNSPALKKHTSFLSFGKVRASYGTTGSDQLSDYQYLSTYSNTTYGYQGTSGLIPNRLVNPDYSWESNRKMEAAIELGLLGNRIYFVASYYRNRSSNQLVGYSLPVLTGFSSIQYNLPAVVQNTGVELEVNTTNIKTTAFTWKSNLNFTVPKNKLISYPNLAASSFAFQYAIGRPLSVQDKYQFMGIDPKTGIYQVRDVDTNGQINNSDLQFIKEIRQQYYGGLQNIISYKNFTLDFLIQFVKQTGTYPVNNPPGSFGNQSADVLNRWQKPGDIAAYGAFTQLYSGTVANSFKDAFINGDLGIVDASFIRLRNLSFSWNMPGPLLQKMKIQNIKLFVQGQNLLTITNYKGLDPESQSLQLIPPLRMLTAGIQLTL